MSRSSPCSGLLALVTMPRVAVGAVTATFSCCECALQPTTPGVEATDAVIVRGDVRFGRVLSVALISAGLAVSGTALRYFGIP